MGAQFYLGCALARTVGQPVGSHARIASPALFSLSNTSRRAWDTTIAKLGRQSLPDESSAIQSK
jgi:alkylated DNA nucleotide flippase Atl1